MKNFVKQKYKLVFLLVLSMNTAGVFAQENDAISEETVPPDEAILTEENSPPEEEILVEETVPPEETILTITEELVATKIVESYNYRAALKQYNMQQRDSQFWSFLVPSANFTVATGKADKMATDNFNGNEAIAGKKVGQTSIGVSLDIALANLANVPITIMTHQNNEISYEQTKTLITNTAKTTFYTLIAAEHQLEVLQSTVNVAQTAYQQTARSYNSGLVDYVTLLMAQYQYQSMLNVLNSSKTQYEGSLLQFKQMLGIDLDQQVVLDGDIEIIAVPFNGDKIAADYLDKALDVRVANNNKTASRFIPAATILSYINPFVSLAYNASKTTIDGLPKNEPMVGTAWKDSIGVNVGLAINLSYKGYSSIYSAFDTASLAREAAEEQYKTTRISIINYANELNNLQGSITIAQQNITINQRSLELTQQGYNQGLKTYTEFQSSLTNVQDAEVALLQSKLDYLKALLNLSAVIGIESENLTLEVQQYNEQLNNLNNSPVN